MTHSVHTGVLGVLLLTIACAPEAEEPGQTARATVSPEQAVADPVMLTYHPDLQIDVTEMIHRASGLMYQDVTEGAGTPLAAGRTAVVRYTVWLHDGTLIESNRDLEPFAFRVGAGDVIEGWDEGLVGMRTGGQRRLIVPYKLGYGETGSGDVPPYATLVFDLELLEIR